MSVFHDGPQSIYMHTTTTLSMLG